MINEEYLKTWEQDHIELLTSKEMGEWLYRRDKNQNRKERPQGECCGSCYLCDVGDCKADMRKGGAE